MNYRKIIHVDMDAFFASVEQRDFPKYRGRPLVVGGVSKRGVVSAASYEARKYGIYSAMPVFQAEKLCPHLVVVPGRHDVYKEVSKQVNGIFKRYTDIIEPLSLDEAFLDVSNNKIQLPLGSLIAKKILAEIKAETQLTASAGVSYNKFLAKIASDVNKPNGMFVIEPKDAQEFLDNLRIEKFFGIGKVTAERMHEIGIFFGRDLRSRSKDRLRQYFGKSGVVYYDLCRGVDLREVNPYRKAKSVGAESTFSENISDKEEMKRRIVVIADILWKRILHRQKFGKTLTLKLKFADFKQITRSKTVAYLINSPDKIKKIAFDLLEQLDLRTVSVRLIGISVSNMELRKSSPHVQLRINFPEDD